MRYEVEEDFDEATGKVKEVPVPITLAEFKQIPLRWVMRTRRCAMAIARSGRINLLFPVRLLRRLPGGVPDSACSGVPAAGTGTSSANISDSFSLLCPLFQ